MKWKPVKSADGVRFVIAAPQHWRRANQLRRHPAGRPKKLKARRICVEAIARALDPR